MAVKEGTMMKKAGIFAAISIVLGASFCSAGEPHREPAVTPAPHHQPHPEPRHDNHDHHGHTGGIVRDIGKAASGVIHELKE